MSQSGTGRELVIPEGIERIEEEAFAGTGLETVKLPQSVTYIADNAFDDDVTFIVFHQSYAEDWAKKNDKAHRVISDSIPEGLYWDIDEEDTAQRAYIKGYTGDEEVLILPDEIEGHPVYRIGESAFSGSALKQISLPAHLEQIGDYAFENCDELSGIEFPGSLNLIGYQAFIGCSSLQTVSIPETVTSIGTYAFADCSGLTSVIFPVSLDKTTATIFKDCSSLKEVTISADLRDSKTVFEGCSGIESVHYLAGASKAFNIKPGNDPNCIEYACKRTLKTIDIGEGITSIIDQAFRDNQYESPELCSVIESVHLPSTLKAIDDQAFMGLTHLTSINVPANLEVIGNEAFAYCSSLVPFDIPDSVQKGQNIFYGCKGSEQDMLPEGLDWGFDENDASRRVYIKGYTGDAGSLSIPDKIEGHPVYRIGEGAFSGSAIKQIRLPAHLEQIDDYAFENCDQLSGIEFPGSLTLIGYQAFINCISVKTIAIPETVTAIGTNAFANCTGLTSVIFPVSLDKTTVTVFKNCGSLKEVTISADLRNSKTVFEGCSGIESVHYLAGASKAFNIKPGNDPNCIEYACKRTLKTIDIGEGITSIIDQAFRDNQYESPELCSVIVSIHLPSTLKTIDDQAFMGLTRLTSINVPKSLELIGNEAFAHCASLVPFDIPDSVSQGQDIFYGCKSSDPEEETAE